MSSVCPDLPAALDAPVLRMLAKDPGSRPASLGAAVDELVEAARSAGIDVPQVATRSSEKLPRLDMPRALTPEQAVFAQADTMVQPPESTAQTGQPKTLSVPEEPPRPKSKVIGFVLGAGLFVAGIVTTLLVVSHQGGPPAEAPAAPLPPPPPPPPPQIATPPGPIVAPTPSVAVVPAATSTIEVRVKATPENADVFLDETKLGAAPGPFKIPQGDKEIVFSVSASGYQTKKIPFTPKEDGTVEAKLEKEKPISAPAKSTGKTSTGKSSGELEF